MQNQPASTMKPVLSYALAVEYLGWNNNKILTDEETTYPNTNISINNIDHEYMGNILIDQAIGYSRNTTSVSTLKEVIDGVGVNKVVDYLKEINLLDVDPSEFNYSYALGAMQYGVSTTQMASAYSMLANKGIFTEAYTVKSIRLQETNELIYVHKSNSKQVLNEETAYIMSDILKSVVDNNYYNMGSVKIDGVEMHAKSGTSSFDSSVLKEYNYPSDAAKDIWFAGYSADYTAVVWSGFDFPVKGEKNYFKSGTDNRKYIPRKIFSKIMNYQAKKGETISLPPSLIYVDCVKGTDFLPDEFTPSNMIKKALYKKGKEPYINISPPELDNISDIDIMIIGHIMYISFKNDDYTELEVSNYYIDYIKLYGNIEYIVEITNELGETYIHKSSLPSFSFNILETGILKIKAYTRYAKINNFTSNIIEKEFDNSFFL
jgi:penicillin-binding protein 1A